MPARQDVGETTAQQACAVDDILDTERGNDAEVCKKVARVHPGETVGSWMMRGVLFFLTDPDNAEAKMLR